jgi:hypothetical protein
MGAVTILVINNRVTDTGLVYSGSLSVVQSVFSCPILIVYGIGGNRVTHRIPRSSHTYRIALSRSGLEHPRPHALRDRCLPSPPAGESANHRQGKSSAGETSLVREPMEGTAPRRSGRRSWPCAVHAGGQVAR